MCPELASTFYTRNGRMIRGPDFGVQCLGSRVSVRCLHRLSALTKAVIVEVDNYRYH